MIKLKIKYQKQNINCKNNLNYNLYTKTENMGLEIDTSGLNKERSQQNFS